MRNRARVDMAGAAAVLGLSTLCVARIEKHTQRIPAGVLRKWDRLLMPVAPVDEQMTIFDLIATATEGEGGPHVL